MKEQILSELGLSKNEVLVYLKLLEIRTATGVDVSKAAKLHRPNVYDALDRLVKKGIVKHFMRENIKYYEPADPEQLMTLIKAKELDLQRIIPELEVLQYGGQNQPSNIVIFEGVPGTRKVWMDMITDTKELYLLGAPKDLVKTVGEGWVNDEWHCIREERKVMFHHIVNEDYPLHRIKFIRQMKHTTIKFLPKQYNAPHAIFINDNGIAMVFIHPLLSIKIMGKEVSESFKQYFDMLYKIALKTAPQEI